LVEPVARYLRNRGFRLQTTEVPFYEYSIDTYGYSRRDNLTIAVELKMANWSRAVEQALVYQLCSDLVYIAMPTKKAQRVNVAALNRHGLGLIGVDHTRCRELIRGLPSQVVRKHYRAECLAMLQEDRRDVG